MTYLTDEQKDRIVDGTERAMALIGKICLWMWAIKGVADTLVDFASKLN